MNARQPRILRTATGYQLGNLETTGLPPRASHALLLTADDYTLVMAAHAMGCTEKNVGNLLARLRDKTGSVTRTGLITRAFERGWLRFVAVIAALYIGFGVAELADNLAGIQTANDDTLRPRGSRSATRRRKGEWYWDADKQRLQLS